MCLVEKGKVSQRGAGTCLEIHSKQGGSWGVPCCHTAASAVPQMPWPVGAGGRQESQGGHPTVLGQATRRFWVPGRGERPCPHHPWAPSHPGLSPSGPQTTGLSRGCRMGTSCALLPRNTQGDLKQADWLPRWHISQREVKRGTGMPGWGRSPGLGRPCRVRGFPGWVPLGKPHELDWSPRVLGAARPRWGCHPGAAQVLVPQHTLQGPLP